MTHTDPGEHTLGRWFVDAAARDPQRAAIDDRGVVLTYERLVERARSLSDALAQAGYGAGDRVVTVSGSSADQVVTFAACALSGLALAPLSVRLSAAEIAAQIERTDPALVLVDEDRAPLAREALELAHVSTPSARMGTAGAEAHVPRALVPRPARAPRDDDPLLILFTSGSEADPKGVVLTHRSCFWTNMALGQAMPIHADDTVLCILPQFHVAAWNVQPLLAWRAGATVVLERGFEPSRVLRLIESRRVTCMMGVPTQYRLLVEDAEWEGTDLGSLRLAVSGGAPTPPDLEEAWASRAERLTLGYGLTEAGPNVLYRAPSDEVHARGRAARPYPHVSVSLRDPATGLEVGPGGQGELWVHGPGLFAGYVDDADATAAVLVDGWLRTGDLAIADGHGGVTIVDRLKDIFISGGENVAPAEVERALEQHSLVARAAVVGVPDRVWGERGMAFVALRPGAAVGVDELLAHCRDRLAGFKVPVRIEIVPDLPRGALDKIARARLRRSAVALIRKEVDG
ncbi:class I adenylate-forming enzyme family protein [Demequina sp. NBRC 110052]|uniref:class I adenylate-forming enzyme family protein n=1 Tax=Demequina sp. NBRC 110052 TaxID=1570341 RepID=UPI000A029366|nr:AMP-binding protein [Demequina sp. NBRC 110052]